MMFLILSCQPMLSSCRRTHKACLKMTLTMIRTNERKTCQLYACAIDVCVNECCCTCLQGETALHTAVLWGCPESVSLLLSHGADLDVKYKVRKIPISCLAPCRSVKVAYTDCQEVAMALHCSHAVGVIGQS